MTYCVCVIWCRSGLTEYYLFRRALIDLDTACVRRSEGARVVRACTRVV